MASVWVPSGGSGEQSCLLSTTALFTNLTQREDPPACPIRSCKRASLPENPRALDRARVPAREDSKVSKDLVDVALLLLPGRPGGVEAS